MYCWRCNEHEESEGNSAPRFLVFGIQLKGVTTAESELCYDPDLFTKSWNVESDADSAVLIDTPQRLMPTVSVSSNLISHGSGDTSKSHDTNENLAAIVGQEYGTDSDDLMPEGVVEGVSLFVFVLQFLFFYHFLIFEIFSFLVERFQLVNCLVLSAGSKVRVSINVRNEKQLGKLIKRIQHNVDAWIAVP